MKIALCFSGQPRFIELMNLDNLIQNNLVDIYAHFWWDESYRGQQFAWNSTLIYPKEYNPIELFIAKYGPRKIIYEKYPVIDLSAFSMLSKMEFDLPSDIVEQSIYRQKSQWMSVNKSINLIDKSYDIVIRARTDLEFRSPICFDDLEAKNLHIMDGSLQAGVGRQYCDWFYLGSQDLMQKFNVLQVFDEFYKNGLRHMHDLVSHAITSLQIPHSTYNFNVWMMNRANIKSESIFSGNNA